KRRRVPRRRTPAGPTIAAVGGSSSRPSLRPRSANRRLVNDALHRQGTARGEVAALRVERVAQRDGPTPVLGDGEREARGEGPVDRDDLLARRDDRTALVERLEEEAAEEGGVPGALERDPRDDRVAD